MDVVTMGRKLGVSSDWDGDPGECMQFYDFESANETLLPSCKCLTLDLTTGRWEIYNDDGETPAQTGDIVDTLQLFPKS